MPKLYELLPYNQSVTTKSSSQQPSSQKPSKQNVNLTIKMPEVAAMVQHLDKLYANFVMAAGKEADDNDAFENINWYNQR